MGHELRWSGDIPWLRKSCLEDYSWCPWKFKHVWIDGVVQAPNRAMVVGTRFHDFAERFFDVCESVEPEHWEDLVPVDVLMPDEVEMWTWFVENERNRLYMLMDADRLEDFHPIAREFKMENLELHLESTCDRADWECKKLGIVSLIEYKTGEKVNDKSLLRQLAFYSLLWKETLGIGSVNVLKLINPRLKVCKEYELTTGAIKDVEKMIREMRECIELGLYPRLCTENKFPYCRVCTPSDSNAFRFKDVPITEVDDVTFEDCDWDGW